jgi:hypothetical protein
MVIAMVKVDDLDKTKEIVMTSPLGFDLLKDILHQRAKQLPDYRQASPNTRYAIQDAVLGAFGIFFTQSPSFLEYQRRLQHTKGHNNAHTLFAVEQIPCDNQVRKLLDPIAPSSLDAVFVEIFESLEQHRMLAHFRVLGDQLLVALDGTNYFSSKAIHCQNCLRRQLSNGQTLYYHAAITPVIVCPGHSQVIALPPEYIMPQDGHDKQDCERAAGKRWLATHAKQVAPHGVTLLGDDLYSNQPFCDLVLHHGFNFIFTCKPDSHPKLYERLALWQATDAIAEHEARHFNGRFTEVTMVRYVNDVLLRSGDHALLVHWFDLTVVNAKTGEQLYHNSSITNHRLTADNVAAIAQAGRGRWKIENENNNVLKTKGYHLEHNFGHGKQYLAACMLSLNLLAFLFHTVLEWSDDKYALLRQVIARRQSFFNDIQALMRYMVFDSWDHLIDFMIRSLELESRFDTT